MSSQTVFVPIQSVVKTTPVTLFAMALCGLDIAAYPSDPLSAKLIATIWAAKPAA